jgi:hypothetical protein
MVAAAPAGDDAMTTSEIKRLPLFSAPSEREFGAGPR